MASLPPNSELTNQKSTCENESELISLPLLVYNTLLRHVWKFAIGSVPTSVTEFRKARSLSTCTPSKKRIRGC